MDEKIWIKNPKILFEKYQDIYPTNYNSLCRLFLYTFSIFLLFKSYKWAYLCLISFIISSILGYIYDNEHVTHKKIDMIDKYKSCRRSTINNPMSNILLIDEKADLIACSDEKQEKIDMNLYWEFYEDENDIYASKKLRNFITMPITSQPNKRNDFLNFLYKDNHAYCKYEGIGCEQYRELRFKK